jgi:hypothetical protein
VIFGAASSKQFLARRPSPRETNTPTPARGWCISIHAGCRPDPSHVGLARLRLSTPCLAAAAAACFPASPTLCPCCSPSLLRYARTPRESQERGEWGGALLLYRTVCRGSLSARLFCARRCPLSALHLRHSPPSPRPPPPTRSLKTTPKQLQPACFDEHISRHFTRTQALIRSRHPTETRPSRRCSCPS